MISTYLYAPNISFSIINEYLFVFEELKDDIYVFKNTDKDLFLSIENKELLKQLSKKWEIDTNYIINFYNKYRKLNLFI